MENAPLVPESDDSSEETSDKKKSRKSKSLGWLAVEPKAAERKPEPPQDKPERPLLKLVETEPTLDKQIEKVAAETEAAPETEAPLEAVGEQETPVVERQLVEAARVSETEPAEPAVEQFRELIVEEGQDSETAFQTVMAELGAEAEVTDDEVEPEAVEAAAPEFGHFEDGEGTIDLNAEAVPAAQEEPEAPTPPPTGGTGGGASVPPTARTGGPGGRPPFGPGSGSPGGPAGFNSLPATPVAATANSAPRRVEYYDQANPATMALFGGIIGYLIGRRRGRIKTEKKLLPIQKKLEKQVGNLQWELQQKEAKIRRAAAEQIAPVVVAERPTPVVEAVKAAEQPVERRRAPEAHKLHGGPAAPEQIGHMLIAAEAAPVGLRAEKASAEPVPTLKAAAEKVDQSKPERIATERRVETMNRTELLNLSEKIVVEGSSLRQIYETHLLGERGLRRLVAEHLQGGDLKKALRREIVEREIDFERDPMMRDRAVSDGNATATSGGSVALKQMIEQAVGGVSSDNEEAAFHKAKADYEIQQQAVAHKQRRLVDISLTAAITLLVAAIIVLYLMRG
jgi:hypothetical protein